MKKNLSVELMRIFGCLIVIACHADFYHSMAQSAPLLFQYNICLFSDGVTLFWMICGFFLFQTEDYLVLWKRTVRRIVLPLCLTLLLSFVVSPILLDRNTAFSVNYAKAYLLNVITLHTPDSHTEHLWYLYAYLLVILIFPLLKKIAAFFNRSIMHQTVFCVTTLLLLIINDYSHNSLFSFGFYLFSALVPACIQILWGHIIYHHRERFCKKSIFLLSPLLILILSLLRMNLNHRWGTPTFTLNVWFTTFSVISMTLLVFFCFSLTSYLPLHRTKVCSLAKHTFCIYILHPFVMDFLANIHVWETLQNYISAHISAALALSLFMILCVCITFLLSLLLSLMLTATQTLFTAIRNPSR